jgi:hypothetical protein
MALWRAFPLESITVPRNDVEEVCEEATLLDITQNAISEKTNSLRSVIETSGRTSIPFGSVSPVSRRSRALGRNDPGFSQ